MAIQDQHDESHPLKSHRTIVKQQIVTGLIEFKRPTSGLFLSSLSAGLEIGFSLLLMGTMLTLFFSEPPSALTRLLVANMYSIGFILVIVGRSELFTEHTALAVLPVLDRLSSLRELLRVWAVVYAGNLLGAALFTVVICQVAPAFHMVDPRSFAVIAGELVAYDGFPMLVSAVLAGWLMGELAWVIGAARDTISQVLFVWIVTTAIGLAGLHHVVVGTAEVLAGVFTSPDITWTDFVRFLLWTTLGNTIGGVFFVAIIKYGHAAHGGVAKQVEEEAKKQADE